MAGGASKCARTAFHKSVGGYVGPAGVPENPLTPAGKLPCLSRDVACASLGVPFFLMHHPVHSGLVTYLSIGCGPWLPSGSTRDTKGGTQRSVCAIFRGGTKAATKHSQCHTAPPMCPLEGPAATPPLALPAAATDGPFPATNPNEWVLLTSESREPTKAPHHSPHI